MRAVQETDGVKHGFFGGAIRGLAGGLFAGVVWWVAELVANWAFGGVLPWPIARMLIQIDLGLGAGAGLVLGILLALGLGRAGARPLALGLVVVYGFLRVYAPPGFGSEALFLAAGVVAAVVGVMLAGPREGALAFAHVTVVAVGAIVFAEALSSEAQSTYFTHAEARGLTLVLLLAGVPLVAIAVDRALGLVVRRAGVRLGLEVAAAGLAAVLLGHPQAATPIDDTLVTSAPPPGGTPDVILVSCDTTRADHMSTYGYSRNTSPNLTTLARDGLNFSRAISPAQWTVPGHASMLTGLYPSRHGAHYSGTWGAAPVISGRNRVFPLGPEKVTLAEMLRDRGYNTAGFVANFANLDRAFGFAQGFGHYEDLPGPLLRPLPHAVRFVQQFVPTFVKEPFRSAGELNAAALAWLDGLPRGRPAFIFLNYLEPHHWLASPPFDRWAREVPGWRDLSRKGFFTHAMPVHLSEPERAFITASYDGQVAAMDASLGELVEGLKRRLRYDNAIIIVTADHGELLGEHDLIGHGGRMMYDGLLHIPMVVKLPGPDRPRGEVKETVQLVDIVPTVLDVLKIAIPPDVQGQVLQHVTHPIVAEEDINPEFVSHYGEVYDRALRVLYDGPYKLITTSKGQRMLFDLAHDPNENDNLEARESERVAEMERRLDAVMSGMQTKVAGLPLERGRWQPGLGLLMDFE